MKSQNTCGAKWLFSERNLFKNGVKSQPKSESKIMRLGLVAFPIFLAFTGGASAQTPTAKPPIDFTANIQTEAARILNEPDRWSTLRLALEIGATAKFGEDVRARVVGQLSSNFAPSVEDNYYPFAVRKDQRFNATVREAFVEMPLGNINAKIGKQYINWGEAVGVFVADVVNARDLREFLLPDFEQLRIGQWAARFDWQGDDKSAELVWIPIPTYDKIGAFGGDYYPIPFNSATQSLQIANRVKPSSSLSKSNVGVRGGFLKEGWDVAAFYYRSSDRETVFASSLDARGPVATPIVGNRISQIGATLSKDVDFAVLKSEAVYTHGKSLATSTLNADGLAKHNTMDWLVGLDIPIPDSEARLNVQAIQRIVLNHSASLISPKNQSYASVQLSYPSGKWEASILAIEGLNQSERLLRPKITYKATKNMRISLGADFFSGSANGLLGQFESKDRVYVRVKHSF
jgi:hypothetical protein